MRQLSLVVLLSSIRVLLVNAELVCLPSLGRNIDPSDCSIAMNDLRFSSILHDFNQRQPRTHTFGSSELVGRRYRVPQGRSHFHLAQNI